MDNAVALVQAYVHVNGYFTVAEYPVLEALMILPHVRDLPHPNSVRGQI